MSEGYARTTVRAIADILFVLASPDVARMLCDVRGWSQAQHAAWLETMLSCALLPEHPRTG